MFDEVLGPYTVAPAQVSALGPAFTAFVNALLRAELATAGLSSVGITTTEIENIGDEGVDVGITRAVETRHIPAGDSAWQFKRGDYTPAKCAAELRGAGQAIATLRNGGRYRLVLGVDINDRLVRSRRKALIEEATKLGITLTSSDAIEVLTASDLAEWAERHPSLSVSHLIGGIRGSVEDFNDWAGSDGAATSYIESDLRKATVQNIQNFVTGSEHSSMRVEGVSGLGKSRTVLEALRGQDYEGLTVYVREADKFQPSLIRYLASEGRIAVLVVDECDARTHKNLAGAMPTGTRSRLITIGEPEPSRAGRPPMALPPMEDHKLAEIVRINRPALGSEAAMFVAEIADGNVRLALVLADAVERSPRAIAAHLITLDEIRTYVTDSLPSGTNFLASCALALLTRVGVTGDAAGDLTLLADGLRLPIAELRAATRTLTDLGLLSQKGRYRSVAPQPLAVYLAARAWEDFADEILNNLLPVLPPPLLALLIERAAEIGPNSPILRVVDALLDRDEVFGSLEVLEQGEHLGVVRSLAILAPQKVIEVLVPLIQSASMEDLTAAQRSRRTLVRTLEALAWHSLTFEEAAGALLRLALAETEDFANNASGAWRALFGVMLPNTAASPRVRLDYLTQVAGSSDAAERRLAASAAKALVQAHETSFVSGERQHGVMVERRGTPATYGDIWAYQKAGFKLLRQLADDSEADIAKAATDALVGAIHPFLEHQAVREDLFQALVTLPGVALRRVRTELTHLEGLFSRVSGVEDRQIGLALLAEALPDENPDDRMRSLLQTQRWELEDGELQRHVSEAVEVLLQSQSPMSIVAVFNEERWEAAFELGHTLAELCTGPEVESQLAGLIDTPNSSGLTGYLHGLVDNGQLSAFDDFIDGPRGQAMSPANRLFLSVRGPQSEQGWARVVELLPQMTPRDGAVGLFGWHINFDLKLLDAIVSDWLPRIMNQDDYSAVVDFVAMALHRHPSTSTPVEQTVASLVELRRNFPDVGQQRWDWTQLAKRQMVSRPSELFTTILDLIDTDALHLFTPSEEANLVRNTVERVGMPAWNQVMAKLASDAWRVQWDFRGWLADALPQDEVVNWIGADLPSARLAAQVVGVGDGQPSPVVRHLLGNFGKDAQISSSLAGDYISGSWSGPESARWERKINQLEAWTNSADEPEGVKRWAREMKVRLVKQRDDALNREAEGDW